LTRAQEALQQKLKTHSGSFARQQRAITTDL